MIETSLRAALEAMRQLTGDYQTWRVRRLYRPERHYMRGGLAVARRRET